MYDIVIVGAGPAGSTLARLLSEDKKILIIDKRNLDREDEFKTEKCCGGLISPDAQMMLAKFGLGVPKSVLVEPQLFTVRTIDIDNKLEKFYQRNYINIDREKFDRWLVSLIPGKVEKLFGVLFKEYKTTGKGIEVSYIENGVLKKVICKNIVGADGSNSKVRKQIVKDDKIKKYISIQEWYEQEEQLPYYSAIFDSEITDYYAWTISKDKNLLVGAALEMEEGKNPTEKFEKLKEKLHRYGYKMDQLVKREGAFISRPYSVGNICTGKENEYLIGEAAGFISPSSAEGFSYAFKSALALAKIMKSTRYNIHSRYEKEVKGLKKNLLLKKVKLPAMYNKFIRKLILKSNLMTITIIENENKL